MHSTAKLIDEIITINQKASAFRQISIIKSPKMSNSLKNHQNWEREKKHTEALRVLRTWLRIEPVLSGHDRPYYDISNVQTEGDRRPSIAID